jgi:hypothetical protein
MKMQKRNSENDGSKNKWHLLCSSFNETLMLYFKQSSGQSRDQWPDNSQKSWNKEKGKSELL